MHLTNYPAPREFSWISRFERDHIEKSFSSKPAARWVPVGCLGLSLRE
jgi:hypothetical protein